MIDAYDFYNLLVNSVDSDVRQAGKNQLTSPIKASLATSAREGFKTTAAIINSRRDLNGGRGVVFLDAPDDAVKIFGGGNCPAQAHQGRSICLSWLPTSSCSTKSPRSAAARPAFTASMKRVSSSKYWLSTRCASSSVFKPRCAAICANCASFSGCRRTSMIKV